MTEWWSPPQAGVVGGVIGSVLGVLGAAMGTLAGILAPRGKGRKAVLGLILAGFVAGGGVLAAGIAAVGMKQRYHVWYPLVLAGGLAMLVMGMVYPGVRARYRQAERRRLEAEEFRRET